MEMVPLPIPSLPPTMTSCSCIKISYEMKVLYSKLECIISLIHSYFCVIIICPCDSQIMDEITPSVWTTINSEGDNGTVTASVL